MMQRSNYQPIIQGNKKRPSNPMEQFKQFCEEMQGVDANAELERITRAGIVPQNTMGQILGYARQHAQEYGIPTQGRRR